VPIGLDDALLAWLVSSAGDSLVHRLRDEPAKAEMRKVVREAVAATVDQVAGGLDDERIDHFRASLQVHDMGGDGRGLEVTNETELRDALHAWTAALDHPEFGEPGYLTGLGIQPGPLADALTCLITDGIRRNGWRGGALNPLAEWLWRDELKADVGEIRRDLFQLRSVVDAPGPSGCGLPGGTPEFVGRRQALAKLAGQIEAHDPAGTVVAIHAVDGMAGAGKTELALHAAHQHKHRYPDGQYCLNLHGYTQGVAPMSPDTALEELLRQAGVPGPDIPSGLAGRQARWRALMAGQRALVLLDNALDVAQVQPLLPMSSGCLVLITSRTRLTGLPGAKPLPLDVLAPDDAVELFGRLAGPGRQDGPAAAEVVGLVGHLPLSIVILAGRLCGDPTLTVTELAADLTSSNARLDETSPPGAGVRATFETSIQRLDPGDRRTFRILGLHPGPVIGVPQFGALAGLPTPHAHTALRRFADQNLIRPNPDRAGHRRYELHDLMREFAREQAEAHLPEERPGALARLSTWYATALCVAGGRWNATSTTAAAVPTLDGLHLSNAEEADAWLTAEHSNVLALADVATGADAADMCMAFGHAWERFGQHHSAEGLYRSAARICSEIEDEHGAAVAFEHVRAIHLARMSCATG
jgi:NB-ARC domain